MHNFNNLLLIFLLNYLVGGRWEGDLLVGGEWVTGKGDEPWGLYREDEATAQIERGGSWHRAGVF